MAKAKTTKPKGRTIATSASKAEIQELQTILGVKPDGIQGPKTKAAVAKLQLKLGVPADGIIGPITLAAARAYAKSAQDSVSAMQKVGMAVAAGPAVSSATPVTSQLLASIPTEAKAVAAQQLQQFAALPPSSVSGDDYNALMTGLSAALGPQFQALSNALAQRAVSTEATAASNAALESEQRWTDNAEAQSKILGALKDLSVKVMAKDKLSRLIYKAYGVQLP